MAQSNGKQAAQDILEQARGVVEKGNRRHVVIRKADGTKLAEVSMTIAFVIVVALIFMGPLGFLISIASIVYGVMTKVRVEVLRELSDSDPVVEVKKAE